MKKRQTIRKIGGHVVRGNFGAAAEEISKIQSRNKFRKDARKKIKQDPYRGKKK